MTQIKNEVISQNPKSKQFQTALAKTQTAYLGMIEQACEPMNVVLSDYQKLCVRNMITKMAVLAEKDGKAITEFSQTNVTEILQQVAMLELNPSATPRECYVIIRNVNYGTSERPNWKKEFEFGLEGDGNDKLLRRYGVGVKKVHPCWVVHKGDDFTYPSFKGLDIEPPTWVPKSFVGQIERIVYPVEYDDGSVVYHISERESVAGNLKAHISNNLIKVKSGTPYYGKSDEINKKVADLTLEQMFTDSDALSIMSPAWKNAGSREEMILRKMRNNAIKKIPKDFSDAFTQMQYEKTYEDYDQFEDERINREEALEIAVEEKAVSEPITASLNIEGITNHQAEKELDKPAETKAEANKNEVPF